MGEKMLIMNDKCISPQYFTLLISCREKENTFFKERIHLFFISKFD